MQHVIETHNIKVNLITIIPSNKNWNLYQWASVRPITARKQIISWKEYDKHSQEKILG